MRFIALNEYFRVSDRRVMNMILLFCRRIAHNFYMLCLFDTLSCCTGLGCCGLGLHGISQVFFLPLLPERHDVFPSFAEAKLCLGACLCSSTLVQQSGQSFLDVDFGRYLHISDESVWREKHVELLLDPRRCCEHDVLQCDVHEAVDLDDFAGDEGLVAKLHRRHFAQAQFDHTGQSVGSHVRVGLL